MRAERVLLSLAVLNMAFLLLDGLFNIVSALRAAF